MTILLISTVCVLTGVLVGLIATATSPVGYEDESGFHFGNEKGHHVPRKKARAARHTAVLAPKPA